MQLKANEEVVVEIVTLEGIVEQGKIKLKDNVHLPEKTRVYVIVP